MNVEQADEKAGGELIYFEVHNCCHLSKSLQGAGLRNTETKTSQILVRGESGDFMVKLHMF